ncbi:MAG: hypothetical protein H7Y59_14130 [Anaerolineales bacterium]|nr:hypothetical protein [Anaerolineales bacterium]
MYQRIERKTFVRVSMFTIQKDGTDAMTSFKRSFLGLAIYLAIVLILGQKDNVDSPIINFPSYFYLTIMVALPVTFLLPSLSKVSVYVPILVWTGMYFILLQSLDRTKSTDSTDLSAIVLELIFLGMGVWLTHQMATQVRLAESLLDALALETFPSHVPDIESERPRIKLELTRSRRYQRPLSLLVIKLDADDYTTKKVKSIRNDLMEHFTFVQVGQIITELLRQTDLFLRDQQGCYIILCPETNMSSVELFATRISQAIENKTGLQVQYGAASFPDEALTFEDLLRTARTRLAPLPNFTNDAILNKVFKDVG